MPTTREKEEDPCALFWKLKGVTLLVGKNTQITEIYVKIQFQEYLGE